MFHYVSTERPLTVLPLGRRVDTFVGYLDIGSAMADIVLHYAVHKVVARGLRMVVQLDIDLGRDLKRRN